MAYVRPDYKSGKAFREAVAAGVEHRPYNPSGIFPDPVNGFEVIEGPHYPKPHRWYVRVEVRGGQVVRCLK